MTSAPIHSLIRRRLRAAVIACLILASCILFVVYRIRPQQPLREREAEKQIVPGPALRAELAALLKEDDYDTGTLDIENYDIEFTYSTRRPEVIFSFTRKQELQDEMGMGLGEDYYTLRGMPIDLYESLVKKDSESANQPPPPDLVTSAEAATALALKVLDAEGVSVSARETNVKSADTFWILEFRFPEGKKPSTNDTLTNAEAARIEAHEVIVVLVSKKTAKVQVF